MYDAEEERIEELEREVEDLTRQLEDSLSAEDAQKEIAKAVASVISEVEKYLGTELVDEDFDRFNLRRTLRMLQNEHNHPNPKDSHDRRHIRQSR